MTDVSIDAIVDLIKENASKIRIIDLLLLISKDKYSHLKENVLNLTFDKFNIISSTSQEDCINIMIHNFEKINNMSISNIQKILGHVDRTILIKSLKYLENKNETGYFILSSGSKRSKKYTMKQGQQTPEKESLKQQNTIE